MNYNNYKYNNSKRYYNDYKSQGDFKSHSRYVGNNIRDSFVFVPLGMENV